MTIEVLANDTDADAGIPDCRSVNGTGLHGTVRWRRDGSGIATQWATRSKAWVWVNRDRDLQLHDRGQRGGADHRPGDRHHHRRKHGAIRGGGQLRFGNRAPPVVIGVLANDTDADVGDTRRVVSVSGAGCKARCRCRRGVQGVIAVGNAFQSLRRRDRTGDLYRYHRRQRGSQATYRRR